MPKVSYIKHTTTTNKKTPPSATMVMKKGFRLPKDKDLTPSQMGIINLPTNQNWVIEGSPGTGKTVMAIYRAGQIAKNKNILLLVFNRPLMLYLNTALNDKFKNCKVYTYHSWLADFYKMNFKRSYPKIDGDRYNPDWVQVLKDCRGIGKKYDHIIIDEAQDFPIELVGLLNDIAKSMTCFIDPNQTIQPGNSNVVQVIKTLCVLAPFTLIENYRNTQQISDVAKLYWKDEGDAPYATARTAGEKPTLIQCNNKNKNGYSIQTNEICKIIQQNKEKTIGIIVNDKKTSFAVYQNLIKILPNTITTSYYYDYSKNNIDFSNSDVVVIPYGVMKGLEFDIVLLPRFEKVRSSADSILDYNRLFVAISRARETVYILYFDTKITNGWIDTMTPIQNNLKLFQ